MTSVYSYRTPVHQYSTSRQRRYGPTALPSPSAMMSVKARNGLGLGTPVHYEQIVRPCRFTLPLGDGVGEGAQWVGARLQYELRPELGTDGQYSPCHRTRFQPSFLDLTATYDVASTIHQSLPLALGTREPPLVGLGIRA